MTLSITSITDAYHDMPVMPLTLETKTIQTGRSLTSLNQSPGIKPRGANARG